ncbi:MAG: ptsN [Caulobacteraceae bacterium]|nr:ptsN [Caulobacteraceae bacterium]
MSDDYSASMIGDLLASGSIAPRLTAATKRQVLSTISEIAARTFRLKAARVFDALTEREALGPTGVGHGVAIPHARVEGLDRMRGIFVRVTPPIDFGAVDDKPVDLVFAILSPASSGSEHLRALARVARALRSAEIRSQLRQASGVDAIRAVLVRDARPSAA